MAERILVFPIILIAIIFVALVLCPPGDLMNMMGRAAQSFPTTVNATTRTSSISEVGDTVYDPDIADMLNNVVIDEYSHALEEHPNSAPLVHECMRNKGPYIQFQIHQNERYLRICLIDENKGIIGFQIVDIVENVAKEKTAYIKKGLKCIKDIFDYAGRNNLVRFKGGL